jgi:hypothetical protein
MISGRSVGYQNVCGYWNAMVPRRLGIVILKAEGYLAKEAMDVYHHIER